MQIVKLTNCKLKGLNFGSLLTKIQLVSEETLISKEDFQLFTEKNHNIRELKIKNSCTSIDPQLLIYIGKLENLEIFSFWSHDPIDLEFISSLVQLKFLKELNLYLKKKNSVHNEITTMFGDQDLKLRFHITD